MQYREDKNGNKISVLGYGCMRFTKNGSSIDLKKAEREIMTAIKGGVNYFDTAYLYPGSEAALGKILKKNNCRDKVYIATKLPQYLVKTEGALEKYWKEQTERLCTDYVDYYLMHMLSDVAAWDKLCRLGIKEWIDNKKKEGKIKNIGFSFHGNSDMFMRIIDAYDWDFCQIQYNYMDEHSQAGRKGLEYAAKKGIPVIIMEPLRGGKLVDMLPEKAKRIIAGDPQKRSAAEIALRWLWDQKEVTCVLSGMNSIPMVKENIRIASKAEAGCLTDSDRKLIAQIKKEINRSTKVGCTGCGYCMPCPKGIDIPTAFSCYNRMFTENKTEGRMEYAQMVVMRKDMVDMGECIGCGKCERRCPQHIRIRGRLREARKALLPWYMRLGIKLIRLFKFW